MSRSPVLPVLALAAVGLAACAQPAPPAASTAPAPTPAAAAAPAAPVAAGPSTAAPQWQDLNGARASSGEGELQRRGFELSTRRGLTAFWNHAPSQTCLRVVTNQGRYAVSQVPFVPNCPL